MKTGILFDLDGTLLDTLEDLKDAVNYTMDQYGCPRRTLEEVRTFVGNGVEQLIRLSVGENADRLDMDQLLADHKAYYRAHCQQKTAPYRGIPQALTQIRQHFPTAIVSNKPDPAVKKLCGDYFGDIYALGESPDCPRKPAPHMLHKAMAQLQVDRCIYVGDSEVDIETARNAGVPCISVLWGFRDEATLRQAGGRFFCRSAEELLPIIHQIINEEHYGQ